MNIKPTTTIRQDYNGFSKYCHELDEPVILVPSCRRMISPYCIEVTDSLSRTLILCFIALLKMR